MPKRTNRDNGFPVFSIASTLSLEIGIADNFTASSRTEGCEYGWTRAGFQEAHTAVSEEHIDTTSMFAVKVVEGAVTVVSVIDLSGLGQAHIGRRFR
jgi:hypothetical protein